MRDFLKELPGQGRILIKIQAVLFRLQSASHMRTHESIIARATAGGILLTTLLQGNCGTAITERSESEATSRGAALPFRAYARGNGFCVAVSHSGRVLSSCDETSWRDINEVNDSFTTFYRAVAYGNSTFVVVGGSYVGVPGVVVTLKSDAVWIRNLSTRDTLHGVAFGNGQFVAVGDHGAIMTSRDGTHWRKQNAGTSDTLFASVAFGYNTFVAVGDSGSILISTEGANWKARPSGTSIYLSKISYDASAFWATGAGGLILFSTDGANWVSRSSSADSVIGTLRQTNEVPRSEISAPGPTHIAQ